MDTSEINQSIDLFVPSNENIIFKLKSLQINLKEILDLKQRYNISNLIKANESILLFIEQSINEEQEKTSTDFEAIKNFLKNVETIKNFFININEEILNLYKIVGLINKSKDILEIFNHRLFTTFTVYSIKDNPLFDDEKLEEKDKNIINAFPYLQDYSKDNYDNNWDITAINSYEQSSLVEKNIKERFIDNCREAVNLVVSNFTIIDNPKKNGHINFPYYYERKFDILKWLLNFNSFHDWPFNTSFDESTGTLDYNSLTSI